MISLFINESCHADFLVEGHTFHSKIISHKGNAHEQVQLDIASEIHLIDFGAIDKC